MGEYYVLNADHTVRPVDDVLDWAKSFEGDDRRVARTEVGRDVLVSTVFLGLDHSFGDGPPLIFETMIFGGHYDQEMWRYSTWDDAVAGHEKAVELAKEGARP